ncbi:MAG: toll/interleukin-1 receptor domain-containing protein [Verrucomicrobiaceae bacterium]|nr:toll/interleukin-1 receptor domain-containing protein [Verrucomicrobiaceae bacterium]
MSDYEHDVFISLAHLGDWVEWVEVNFLKRFNHWLATELERESTYYLAKHAIYPGDGWPRELAENLARSRTLLAICTSAYPKRPWCQLEFSMMRAREEKYGLRTTRTGGLIVPVIAHDCDDSPRFLSGIHPVSVKGLTYKCLCPEGKEAQILDQRIEAIAKGVAKAISCAPPFEKEWEELTCDCFIKLFEEHNEGGGPPRNPRLF